jgi:hypothetical protein
MNPFTPDGVSRYAKAAGTYCPGDGVNGGTVPVTTSCVLREPTDTYVPGSGAPITSFVKQHPGDRPLGLVDGPERQGRRQ